MLVSSKDSIQHFEGSCHCSAIGLVYSTALAPNGWSIRACQCDFCRKHAALPTSDPDGTLEFLTREPDTLHRYRFGQRTADFLLCRHCGIYIGAMMHVDGKHFGIINVRVLRLNVPLPEAVTMNFDGETVAERQTRRLKRWMPVAGFPK